MPMSFPEELIFGIPEIDEQHKNLFSIYNNFSDAIVEGHGEDGLSELFTRLEDVTASHFRFEERLIDKSNYPNAVVHLQEHIQTINDIKQFKEILHTGAITKELLLSIKRYLIRMLINHTKNCDLRLCRHLQGFQDDLEPVSDNASTFTGIKRIGEILVELEYIRDYTLEMALERQKDIGQPLGEVLIGMGAVKAEDIIEAHAIQIGLLNNALDNENA